MQIRNAMHLAILLALYSVAGAAVTVGAGQETFCYWTRSAAEGRTHYSFLQLPANGHPRSLRLYHSVWTRDRSLVDCAVTDELAVTESYLSLCRSEQVNNFTDILETRFNVSLLFALNSPCTDPFPEGVQALKRAKREVKDLVECRTGGDGSEVKLRRQKRAWIIPGTVWCGSGNKAVNYHDLGMFTQTDMCCREHDHCADTIQSFKFGYGIFNRHFFTVLHCDCEERFRQCLLAANSKVSNMVGYGYFNLLKTPCFTFTEKMQCVETNWFGMCTLSKMSPFAVLQEPMGYNSTQPVPEDEQFGSIATPGASTGTVTSDLSSTSMFIQDITSDSVSPTPMLVKDITFDSVSPTPMLVKDITSDSVSSTPMLVKDITFDSVSPTPMLVMDISSNFVSPTPMPVKDISSNSVSPTPMLVKDITSDSVYPTPMFVQDITSDAVSLTSILIQNITSDSVSLTPMFVQDIPSDSVSPTPMLVQDITTDSVSSTPTLIRNIIFDPVSPTSRASRNITSSTAGIGQLEAHWPKPQLPCRPKGGPTKGRAPRPGRRRGSRRLSCVKQPNPPLPPKGLESDAQLTAVSTGGAVDPNATPHQRHENALPTARPRTPRPVPHNQPAPVVDTRRTEMQQPCDCYKHLDECRLKIPPLGARFGLKNPELKTLYHCNCTNRLAQQLQEQEEPDGVQSLLVDYVSQSCFLLAPPEECPGTVQGCPAVLTEASHLRQALSQRVSTGREMYPAMPISKVKRHNTRKTKRKQIPVKLYRKCLKIMDSKASKRVES